MATRKSMAPKRKGKKQYPLVTFTFDAFDGDFTLPKLSALPLGVARGLANGDVNKLIDFLEENAPDYVEAIEDLSGEEAQEFMQLWAEAGGDDAGK